MDAKIKNNGGSSRRWILAECDASLKRMALDHIDIYYLHRDDPRTPLDETVQAIGELIRAGKIRYFGVSNFRGWRIAEVVHLCERFGVPRPVVCQPYYNLLNRMPEVEILPACDHHGIGVVPYSPIARGVLTGKYAKDAVPQDSRAGRKDKRLMETEFREESLEIARKLKVACRGDRTHAGTARARLVVGQPHRLFGDRRTADAGAMERLRRSNGHAMARRRRGAGRLAGAPGPSVHARLYRSELSVLRTTARVVADGRRDVVRVHVRHRGGVLSLAPEIALARAAHSPVVDAQKARYREILEEFQIVGRRNVVCGLHVHVAVPPGLDSVVVMNRVMHWLPVFLALSKETRPRRRFSTSSIGWSPRHTRRRTPSDAFPAGLRAGYLRARHKRATRHPRRSARSFPGSSSE